jgi:hypothetical protein
MVTISSSHQPAISSHQPAAAAGRLAAAPAPEQAGEPAIFRVALSFGANFKVPNKSCTVCVTTRFEIQILPASMQVHNCPIGCSWYSTIQTNNK